MTRVAKITYLVALVLGLAGGTLFRYRAVSDVLKFYSDARQETAPMALEDFSFMQYRRADAAHARAALLAYADLLEQLESLHQDQQRELRLANTYVRLASLEDAANNPQASRDYMAKARSSYTTSGGQNRSDSEMKAAVANADERLERPGLR